MKEVIFSEQCNGFDGLLSFLNNLLKDDGYVFRGYSLDSEIYPSLMRKSLLDKEFDLLALFDHYSGKYYRCNSPIDFLSCAQHYGVPTRLLDFSFNPFKALAFAL